MRHGSVTSLVEAIFALSLALLWACTSAAQAGAPKRLPFTSDFPIEDCNFATTGDNPYFELSVGKVLEFSNQACVDAGDCDELETVTITVLNQTRSIDFEVDGEQMTVVTRVVEEHEEADGEVSEISLNYFAECQGTEDVYYFGEDVDNYENGQVVNHDGSWLAGEDDALPGLIMPGGAFLLGSRYYQEVAPGVALDRAEHVKMGVEITVPAGDFEDCIVVKETTPLEPKSVSHKVYCPDTGLVVDDELQLEAVFD